jgi:hypothetical protein
MLTLRSEYLSLEQRVPQDENPLKWMDEYNYCKFTKGWIA